MPAGTNISRVMRMRLRVLMQTLHNKVDEIRAQLIAATGPLMTHIEWTPQSVQQTAAAVGQALECASAAQAQTSEVHTEVEGALHQQVVRAQT